MWLIALLVIVAIFVFFYKDLTLFANFTMSFFKPIYHTLPDYSHRRPGLEVSKSVSSHFVTVAITSRRYGFMYYMTVRNTPEAIAEATDMVNDAFIKYCWDNSIPLTGEYE